MVTHVVEMVRELLVPNSILESVDEIPVDDLYHAGYRTFFLDVDNTLLTYEQHRVSLQNHQWVDHVRSRGFSVYLISNNSSHRRILRVGEQVGVKGLYFSMKPFPFCARELALDEGNLDFKKSIFVGDKLFTDIVIGNWLEAHTILVDPMDKKESFLQTMQRDIELLFLKKLKGSR